MPTGSLCAERNVIGSALTADLSLLRRDIKAVAVLSVAHLDRPSPSAGVNANNGTGPSSGGGGGGRSGPNAGSEIGSGLGLGLGLASAGTFSAVGSPVGSQVPSPLTLTPAGTAKESKPLLWGAENGGGGREDEKRLEGVRQVGKKGGMQ